MRSIYFLILFFFLSNLLAQNHSVSINPKPLCLEEGDTLIIGSPQISYLNTDLEPDHDYGSLGEAWNPIWCYIKGDHLGAFEFMVNPNERVGYAIYGPFDDYYSMTNRSLPLGDSIESPLIRSADFRVSHLPFIPQIESGKFYLITFAAELNTQFYLPMIKTPFGDGTVDCSSGIHAGSNVRIIRGKLFFDANQNFIQDPMEYGIPDMPVFVLPTNETVYSVGMGKFTSFTMDSNSNNYTVEYIDQPSSNWSIVGSPMRSLFLDSINNVVDTIQFPLFPKKIICQGNAEFVSSSFFCQGTTNGLYLDLQNLGHTPLNSEVKIVFDSRSILNSASHPVQNVIQDTLYFSVDNIYPSQNQLINFFLEPNDTLVLGDSLSHYVEVVFYDTLGNICGSMSSLSLQPVLCSYDPNNKIAEPVNNSNPNFVLNNGFIDYTINFENMGTADAVNIRIEDSLSAKFNLSSFEKLSSSHNYRYSISEDGLLKIYFDDIFLPFERPQSQGYFKFRIQVQDSLPPLDTIYNTAYIYFDLNDPIITNRSTVVLDCYIKPSPLSVSLEDDFISVEVEDENLNFQWFFDHIEMVDEIEDHFPLQGAGNYYVVARNEFGCKTVYSLIINENSNSDLISVFPNPFTNQFTLGLPWLGSKNIEIHAVDGAIVRSVTSNRIEEKIDLSDLESGLYFVKVINEGKSVGVKKIIKN